VPPAEPEPDCWLHPAVAVAPSRIAGSGLVTTAPLPAATVVSRLGGRLVSSAELDALVGAADGDVDSIVDSIVVDEDRHLVLPPGTPNHFVNHSCDPTMWWLDEYTLITRRDVAAGEELTSDYATSSARPDFVLYCHCETYRCRQVIEGTDWRIPQLQQRYAGHWVPYLQRLIERTR